MTISNETLPVKSKSNTIIRVIHNGKNPFVQLNKEALWDENLSMKAVGLWARCLSKPDDWRFNIEQLAASCKDGRKAIDSAMKELIQHHYACRFEAYEKDEKGKFSKKIIEYVFFEFPATEEDKNKQWEIFKKSFRDCRFGNLRGGNFRNGELLIKNISNTDLTEKEKQAKDSAVAEVRASFPKIKKEKKMPRDYDPRVQEAVDKIIAILKNHKPDWIPPNNLLMFYSEVETMLLREKRSENKIFELLEWALNDNKKVGDWNGWACKLYSRSNACMYLRKHFDEWDMANKAQALKKPKKLDLRKLVREKFPHGSENNGVFCYHDGEQIRFERGMTGYDLHDKTIDYEEKLKIILDRFKLKIEDL